jgi:hypothetical protein
MTNRSRSGCSSRGRFQISIAPHQLVFIGPSKKSAVDERGYCGRTHSWCKAARADGTTLGAELLLCGESVTDVFYKRKKCGRRNHGRRHKQTARQRHYFAVNIRDYPRP